MILNELQASESSSVKVPVIQCWFSNQFWKLLLEKGTITKWKFWVFLVHWSLYIVHPTCIQTSKLEFYNDLYFQRQKVEATWEPYKAHFYSSEIIS